MNQGLKVWRSGSWRELDPTKISYSPSGWTHDWETTSLFAKQMISYIQSLAQTLANEPDGEVLASQLNRHLRSLAIVDSGSFEASQNSGWLAGTVWERQVHLAHFVACWTLSVLDFE